MWSEEPEQPEEPDIEDDVPLADAPKTGGNSGIWVTTAAMSAMGLVMLTLISKRKEEREEA